MVDSLQTLGRRKRASRAQKPSWAVLGFLLALTSFTASAVDDVTINELLDLDFEELLDYEVVTATKSGIRLSDTPGAVSVITYDQIRRSSARTIPELLRMIPGINVRWNPMIQTIDIRGFGSSPFTNRTLLLIDGVPYNSWNKGGFPQHPGFDFFNLENVKHIEIVRGPGSALYGENALNGVINIITLSGEEYGQTRISLTQGEDDRYSYGITYGSRIGDDSSLLMSLRRSQNRLPTTLWTEENDALADTYDVFLKGKYKRWQFSYYGRRGEYDGFEVDLIPGSVARSAEEIAQTVNIASLQYNHRADDGSWSLQANGSFANRDGAHCGACHAPAQTPEFLEEEDHGDQLFANAQFGWHKIPNHDLLLGIEFRKLDAGDHTNELLGATSQPNGKDGGSVNGVVTNYSKGALFVQDRMTFLDGDLEVTAGLRYDSETSPELLKSEWFPRIAAVAEPTDKLTLRAGWSEAARYPSFTELYQDSWFLAAEFPEGPPLVLSEFAPNPDLRSERIGTFEFGAEYKLSDNVLLKADFYANTIEDPVVLVYNLGTPTTLGFENHPNEAKSKGFEFEVRAQPSRKLSTFLNWSYQDNSQSGNGTDSSGQPIAFTYSPEHKVNLGLTVTPFDGLSSTLEVNWRDEYTAPSFWFNFNNELGEEGPLDDYTYVNWRADYQLPFNLGAQNRPLKLSLTVRNLGNQQPFETFTGFGGRALGRLVYLQLEYDLKL